MQKLGIFNKSMDQKKSTEARTSNHSKLKFKKIGIFA